MSYKDVPVGSTAMQKPVSHKFPSDMKVFFAPDQKKVRMLSDCAFVSGASEMCREPSNNSYVCLVLIKVGYRRFC